MGSYIKEFFWALLRQWEPLATGAGALVVTGVVDRIWPEHAPIWAWLLIIAISVLISAFLAWRSL